MIGLGSDKKSVPMCMFVSVEDLRLVAKMICMILLKAKFGGHVVGCFDLAG